MALPRPSRRGLLLALACSVAALLAALSALPARWLLLAAPPDGIVSLADASGTIWNGSAWIALGPPGARRAAAGPAMAMALAHAGNGTAPSLAARPAAAESRLDRRHAIGAVAARAGRRAVGAGLALEHAGAARHAGTRQTLPLGGRLPAGPLAELRWRDAATALAPVNPVGSYVLRLQAMASPAARWP